MGIYDAFERYLPEMAEVREQYEQYLKANNISNTAEKKLFDYMTLVSASYRFNADKMQSEFSAPDIAAALQTKDSPLSGTIRPLSERMRYHDMQDKAEFSPFVINELHIVRDNIVLRKKYAWLQKRFPADTKLQKHQKTEMIRYALNVKPHLGLFRKLDDFCLKYDAFAYKVADEKMYNWRVDPVIIYAQKHNQAEMLPELAQLIKPYRRQDEYEALGYENLGNGIYSATEVKKEQIQQLKYDILTKEEREVFTHPLEDDDEQENREAWVMHNIYADKNCPLKRELAWWLSDYEYDYAVSNAQYQAAKLIVGAYNKTRQNEFVKSNLKQGERES